jgi:Tfp pilus assembly protein PilF
MRESVAGVFAVPVLVLVLLTVGAAHSGRAVHATSEKSLKTCNVVLPPNPDVVCAECHQKIYDSYEKTAMARGSGLAEAGLPQGEFFDSASGVHYRVFMRAGKAWLTYDRDASDGRPALHGEHQLLLYLGSGGSGRAYLYEVNGQWFETRINYYSLIGKWQIAPGNTQEKWMSSPLLINASCLHCHASAVQTPLPGSENRFARLPFQQAGVGCSSCHGDATQHVATFGAARVVDPAKLSPMRRDSVCLQCHIEGNVAVFQAEKSLLQFRPGDDLSQFVAYFVKSGAETGGWRAVSQYEALMHSACKRASRDKLTCITCHDPHYEPSAAERVSYYRSKCLMCHTGVKMAMEHFPQQPDCTACHMPTHETTDISHDELTDHDIEALPGKMEVTDAATDELVPLLRNQQNDRALGLAYAQLAERGDRNAGEKALGLLKKAEKEGNSDEQVHTQLGFLEQMSGDLGGARDEYAAAIAEDPNDVTAMANLAVLDAVSGQADEAVSLLKRVIADDPSRTAAGLNLAFIDCRLDRKTEALTVLHKLSELNPDNPALVEFATKGMYAGQKCELK